MGERRELCIFIREFFPKGESFFPKRRAHLLFGELLFVAAGWFGVLLRDQSGCLFKISWISEQLWISEQVNLNFWTGEFEFLNGRGFFLLLDLSPLFACKCAYDKTVKFYDFLETIFVFLWKELGGRGERNTNAQCDSSRIAFPLGEKPWSYPYGHGSSLLLRSPILSFPFPQHQVFFLKKGVGGSIGGGTVDIFIASGVSRTRMPGRWNHFSTTPSFLVFVYPKIIHRCLVRDWSAA